MNIHFSVPWLCFIHLRFDCPILRAAFSIVQEYQVLNSPILLAGLVPVKTTVVDGEYGNQARAKRFVGPAQRLDELIKPLSLGGMPSFNGYGGYYSYGADDC